MLARKKIGYRRLTEQEMVLYNPVTRFQKIRQVETVEEFDEILKEKDVTLAYFRRSDCGPSVDFDPFIFKIGAKLNRILGKGISSQFIYGDIGYEGNYNREMQDFAKENFTDHVPTVLLFSGTRVFVNMRGNSKETRRYVKNGLKALKKILEGNSKAKTFFWGWYPKTNRYINDEPDSARYFHTPDGS